MTLTREASGHIASSTSWTNLLDAVKQLGMYSVTRLVNAFEHWGKYVICTLIVHYHISIKHASCTEDTDLKQWAGKAC